MNQKNTPWYRNWFNEDYLKLYAHRTLEEAKQQVEFLEKALELKGDEKILDLGCGMGRHSIAFAIKGYTVTGVDASEYLIKQAKHKLAENPTLPVTFIHADIKESPPIGTFDLIISMFTSFGYFDEDKDNQEILSIVRKHLNPGGQFFLDYLHPFHVKKTLKPYEKKTVEGESVEIKIKIENDMAIKNITFPERRYQERVKLYARNQIQRMLQAVGFVTVDVWNDYQGNPWRPDGERQLFRVKIL